MISFLITACIFLIIASVVLYAVRMMLSSLPGGAFCFLSSAIARTLFRSTCCAA